MSRHIHPSSLRHSRTSCRARKRLGLDLGFAGTSCRDLPEFPHRWAPMTEQTQRLSRPTTTISRISPKLSFSLHFLYLVDFHILPDRGCVIVSHGLSPSFCAKAYSDSAGIAVYYWTFLKRIIARLAEGWRRFRPSDLESQRGLRRQR
jgi:hypothetical protein